MASEPTGRKLWTSEVLVSDLVGRLMEFWGFKRNMGRVWAVLYLSDSPLAARDLQEALRLSAGAVSMTLNELGRWGVVKRVWVPGERRDFHVAEVQIWKMVSRVFSEREGGEIRAAIESCEEALRELEPYRNSDDEADRARAKHQEFRILALLGVAKLGHQLLSSLIDTAKVDVGPLSQVELGDDP